MENKIIASKTPYCVTLEPKKYSFCTCGYSKAQPFCDSEHRNKTDLKSIKFEIIEKKKVYLCGCKQSNNQPYCDGTHKSI
jgi:CDGSH-type Zn-finger protein